MNAIVQEMNAINFSDLDDVSKREKTDRLRKEFEVILNEQKIRVEEIMKDQRVNLRIKNFQDLQFVSNVNLGIV